MADGIRATVVFPQPAPCEIADVSRETDSIVESVWTSVPVGGDTPIVSEFVVDADEPPRREGVERVVSLGGRHVLRFDHGATVSCPCECLGQNGCAVQRYRARSGTLRLVFNAADFDELRTVVGDLRERFPDVDVRRLVRSPGSAATRDAVYVDRGKLTDRQLEVLRTAYRMGYFERSRESNASEVAAALGIDPSTFTEHLASAQRKLLSDVLEDGA